ncbi:glutathione peroxidase gpx1 [Rhizophlyctis rosea]|uniref:Glutathione peroxidase n=1 Tax=Rhizophlyctis rosea TaxID=64517 RepID=A0AAD5SDW1_9FUNG|nr:glutathione peroxidase gpx1 [Rhizophlyctis rosea]
MSLYDVKINDRRGQPFDLKGNTEGKVVLIVNVASQCGFTPQYKGLQGLYDKYKEKGFVILGVPCNQFGGQEPGTAEEAASACQLNFGVNFPILEKVEVNGDNVHPLYQFLKAQKSGLLGLTRIKWNFEKFLLDRQGNVVERYGSITTPDALEGPIEKLL